MCTCVQVCVLGRRSLGCESPRDVVADGARTTGEGPGGLELPEMEARSAGDLGVRPGKPSQEEHGCARAMEVKLEKASG